jgi:pilus assembly protein Flp/PilA
MGGLATDRLSSMQHDKDFFLEMQMLSIFRRLVKNDKGATAIEYALIAALISVAAVVVMGAVGTGIKNTLTSVTNNLT